MSSDNCSTVRLNMDEVLKGIGNVRLKKTARYQTLHYNTTRTRQSSELCGLPAGISFYSALSAIPSYSSIVSERIVAQNCFTTEAPFSLLNRAQNF